MITKFFAEEGDTIEVGGQFLEIDTDAKAPEGGATPAPPKQEAAPAVFHALRVAKFPATVRLAAVCGRSGSKEQRHDIWLSIELELVFAR